MTLPREVGIVLLAAPLVVQPVANPDFFATPVSELAVEIAANYLPAFTILAGLVAVWRTRIPAVLPRFRLAVHVGLCAAVALGASALVHPLHLAVLGDDVPWLVYAQRNVGFTALAALPALLLDEHRTRVREAEARARALAGAAAAAELEALRSRTRPHFLFNALNTVASLVHDDPALAERTVHALADLLRYTLVSGRAERVPFGDELDAALAYVAVQQARFGFAVDVDVDAALRDLPVAPLLLQPLVENAVLHGVAGRDGARIRISAARRGGALVVRIADDGPGPGASGHHGSGTGLADLRRRLALLHGEAGRLELQGDVGGGAVSELRVPA